MVALRVRTDGSEAPGIINTAEFTLCYGLHDCSHPFQGCFIHPLSTLYYYNAPSLTTRLTGDYRDRTYTGKCSPALLDTRKKKAVNLKTNCFINMTNSFSFNYLFQKFFILYNQIAFRTSF